MEFIKDYENKKVSIKRMFAAPVETVWRAWTESEKLEQWWAPKPWKAETVSMDFKNGGAWIYAMVGPNGERHCGRADYENIVPLKTFTAGDAFCDENGVVNTELPVMKWVCSFEKFFDETEVKIEVNFSSKEDLVKLTEMGFEEGFTMALGNLDELLAGKN